MEEVEWRAIKDFDGYEVSSDGQVRGLDRLNSRGYFQKGKILKPILNGQGYYQVTLRRDNHSYTRWVSALVALAFIGPRPDGHHVCHGINGPKDNSRGNIYYGTPARNARDKFRDNTFPVGSRAYQAKITEEQAEEILRRAVLGEKPPLLGREYGLTPGAVRQLIIGKNWRHITRPPELPAQPLKRDAGDQSGNGDGCPDGDLRSGN